MKFLSGLLLAAGLLGLTAGCGGSNEKATPPDKFILKPDGPPSAAGMPQPGTPPKGKTGGGAAEQ